MLETEDFIKQIRQKKSDFTRNRKLNFKELIIFILTLPKKTLQVELTDYFFQNEEVFKGEKITKQAFSKARQKVDEKVFKNILKKR